MEPGQRLQLARRANAWSYRTRPAAGLVAPCQRLESLCSQRSWTRMEYSRSRAMGPGQRLQLARHTNGWSYRARPAGACGAKPAAERSVLFLERLS